MKYVNTHCRCAQRHGIPSWCEKWFGNSERPFCVLNGGLHSKSCPGAYHLSIYGEIVNDYVSSHPSVCNKSSRKLSFYCHSLYCMMIVYCTYCMYDECDCLFIIEYDFLIVNLARSVLVLLFLHYYLMHVAEVYNTSTKTVISLLREFFFF